MNQTRKRIILDDVDLAKGLAIVLVVWGHVIAQILSKEAYPNFLNTTLWLKTAIYAFHMPLFFAMSGLVVGLPGADFSNVTRHGNMLKKRVWRLLIPYITLSLIQIPILAVGRDHMAISQIPAALLTMFYQPSAHLWFVVTLFGLFALVPLVEKLTWRRPWLVVLLLLTAAINARFISHPHVDITPIRNIAENAIYFYIGVLMGRAYATSDTGWPGIRRLFWPCAIGFLILMHLQYGLAIERFTLPTTITVCIRYLTGIVGTFAALRLCQLLCAKYQNNTPKWILSLSRYSYDIYLFHFLLVSILDGLFLKYGMPYILLYLIVVPIGTIIPLLWGKFVLDRVSILALLCRGQRLRKKPSQEAKPNNASAGAS